MDNTRKADLVEEAASINIVIRRVQEKLNLSRAEAKGLVELAILSEIGGKLTDANSYLDGIEAGQESITRELYDIRTEMK